jgi:hypothetical protein
MLLVANNLLDRRRVDRFKALLIEAIEFDMYNQWEI